MELITTLFANDARALLAGILVLYGCAIVGAFWLCLRAIRSLDAHEQQCEERTVRLYDKIQQVQVESNDADRRIEDKLDTIIPLIHRIDERTGGKQT